MTELLDAFGDFTLEDDEEDASHNVPKAATSTKYVPFMQTDAWFLAARPTEENELREALYHRGSYHYHRREYPQAYETFLRLLELGGHKPTHEVSIVDSLIRAALKAHVYDGVPSLLRRLEANVASFGEQLQFWELAAQAGRQGIVSNSVQVRCLVLLCATCDAAAFWHALAAASEQKTSHLALGATSRALQLLQNDVDAAEGPHKDKLREKLGRWESECDAVHSKEKLSTAASLMCGDIRHEQKAGEKSDGEAHPPPHRCKVDSKKKSPAEQEDMLRAFAQAFPFIFQDDSLLVDKLVVDGKML